MEIENSMRQPQIGKRPKKKNSDLREVALETGGSTERGTVVGLCDPLRQEVDDLLVLVFLRDEERGTPHQV